VAPRRLPHVFLAGWATLPGLTLVYAAFSLPFTVFFLTAPLKLVGPGTEPNRVSRRPTGQTLDINRGVRS
jgi:hypothetical protein